MSSHTGAPRATPHASSAEDRPTSQAPAGPQAARQTPDDQRPTRAAPTGLQAARATPTARQATGATPPARQATPTARQATGATLLLSDVRTAWVLVDELRYRALARLFGVSRSQANLVTIVGISMLAEAVHDRAVQVLTAPIAPTGMDGVLFVAGARGLLREVAGPPSAAIPGAAALMAFAVVGGHLGPSLASSLREARERSRRMSAGFHRRYGYLVDPGHWRERRARRGTAWVRPASRDHQTVAA